MFRNSLIISTCFHVLLLIGVSFPSPSCMVSRKAAAFLELYGVSSGKDAGSRQAVAVDAGKRMQPFAISREKAATVSKAEQLPPAGFAVTQSQPTTASVTESKEQTATPQLCLNSEPGGFIAAGSAIPANPQNPVSGDANSPNDTGGNDAGCANGKSNDDGPGDVGGSDNSDNNKDGVNGKGHDDSGGTGPGSQRGVLLYAPQPDYPAQARRNNWEGATLLELRIDPEGKVENATVLQSSGYPLLDRTAEKTVKKWRYRPAGKGGIAVAWQTRVRIKFVLKD
jgi:protein TonB